MARLTAHAVRGRRTRRIPGHRKRARLSLRLLVGFSATLGAVFVFSFLTLLGQPGTASADESCDQDGIRLGYNVAFSPGPPPGYRITSVSVSEIAASCLGAKLLVVLQKDGTAVGSAGPVDVEDVTMTVPLATPPLASIVNKSFIQLDKLTAALPGTSIQAPQTPSSTGGPPQNLPSGSLPASSASNGQAPASQAPVSGVQGSRSSPGPSSPAPASQTTQAVSEVQGARSTAEPAIAPPPSPEPDTLPIGVAPVPVPLPTPAPKPEVEDHKVASSSYRPGIVRNLPGIDEVATSLKAILTNAGFAVGLLGLVLIDSTIFNSILKENADLIHGFLQRRLAPLGGFIRLADGLFGKAPGRVFALKPLLVLSLSALVYSLLDSGFGLNNSTLVLFFSLVFGLAVATYVNEGGQVLVAEQRFGIPFSIQFFPAAIMIALVSVIVSRLSNFQPGIIFGFVAAAKEASRLTPTEKEDGVINFVPMVALVLVSVAAWLAISSAHSFAESNGLMGAVVEAGCVMLFAGSIQGLLFTLIPLTFLDGLKLWKWSKLAWLSLALPITFLFFHTVLNQDGTLSSATTSSGIIALYAIAIASWFITVAAWLYFRKINRYGGIEAAEEDLEASRH